MRRFMANPLIALGRFVLVWFIILLSPGLVFSWTGKAVHIKDGDTIVVLRDHTEVDVRLYGIDCPEKRQHFGTRAKRFTAKMVGMQRVEVQEMDVDRYGRVVGLVALAGSGESLNAALLYNGLAWVYHKYCGQDFCGRWITLERKAKLAKRGLWGQPNPIPPWEWRHGGRSGSQSRSGAGGDKDCSDFSTQAQAQRFFEAHQPGDPHQLDGDGDGQVCEGLP
ncbi:thermonuclease family protein [Desulfohalobium retbaense]|uniref:Nuclease (SNase domain protein) n=1 Tax=Desulfohalobium retbaense (strain ATCC 49708 / DSM 5692 / JCM 16813 / HR100) TaxID=485915 RepID=C8X3B4_DESRD|nr:thermonuclease family protein [Desulfohalobium retbaense]ACV68911.1 nuclease (SNase domain protein) [Desulfohalobium retbaense DSM 5692]